MNKESILNCERTKLERWSKFQLPNMYKKVGYVLAISSFIVMILMKTLDSEPEWLRPILKQLMIVGFLIVSLSKEKVEDEMIKDLRSKSYALAFVMGVFYSITLPFAGYVVDVFLGSESGLSEASFFEGLLSMLGVQIAFFEVLKRNR